jgi:hypothetical protein
MNDLVLPLIATVIVGFATWMYYLGRRAGQQQPKQPYQMYFGIGEDKYLLIDWANQTWKYHDTGTYAMTPEDVNHV